MDGPTPAPASRWGHVSLKPSRVPFSVTYRQRAFDAPQQAPHLLGASSSSAKQTPRPGLSATARAPHSSTPATAVPTPSSRARTASVNTQGSGGAPSSDRRRPASAVALRSVVGGGGHLQFRSASQWASALLPHETSEEHGDGREYYNSSSGGEGFASSGVAQQHHVVGTNPQSRPLDGTAKALDLLAAVRNANVGDAHTDGDEQQQQHLVSLWLQSEGSVGESMEAGPPPPLPTPIQLPSARSRQSSHTQLHLLATARTASQKRGPPSPRQLTYLDGIIVKLGAPLPPSAIPERFHVSKELPLPIVCEPAGHAHAPTDYKAAATQSPTATAVVAPLYGQGGSRRWKQAMFPTQLPTSREEVQHLASVLDVLLSEHASAAADEPSAPMITKSTQNGKQPQLQQQQQQQHSARSGGGRPSAVIAAENHNHNHNKSNTVDGSGGCDDDAPAAVVAAMSAAVASFTRRVVGDLPAWEVVLFELVRQCFVQCEERGALLERVRCRYLQLKEDALALGATARGMVVSACEAQMGERVAKEAAQAHAVDMQAKLDDLYAQGGPEREAGLQSMVTAMSNMNTVLSNRLAARNAEVDRLKHTMKIMSRRIEELEGGFDDRALPQDNPHHHQQECEHSTPAATAVAAPNAHNGSTPLPQPTTAPPPSTIGTVAVAASPEQQQQGSDSVRTPAPSPSAFLHRAQRATSASEESDAAAAADTVARRVEEAVFASIAGRPLGADPAPPPSRPPGKDASAQTDPVTITTGTASALFSNTQRQRPSGVLTSSGGEEGAAAAVASRLPPPTPVASPAPAPPITPIAAAPAAAIVKQQPSPGTKPTVQHKPSLAFPSVSSDSSQDDEDDGDAVVVDDGNSDVVLPAPTAIQSVVVVSTASRPASASLTRPLPGNDTDDAAGYAPDDKIRYGTLFDLNNNNNATAANNVLVGAPVFSRKLSRAEAVARFRRRFKLPLEWDALISDPSGMHLSLGSPLSRNALHHLLWQILVERWRSEEKLARDGAPLEPLGQFVVSYLSFKFGTRELTQARLGCMLASVANGVERDRLTYFFARCTGLTEPLPTPCVSAVLQSIAIACDDVWMTPSTTHSWNVRVPLGKALEAVRTVGGGLYNADVTLAEARLQGFVLFPALQVTSGANAVTATPIATTATSASSPFASALSSSRARVRTIPEGGIVDDVISCEDSGSDSDSAGGMLPERLARNVSVMMGYIHTLDSALARANAGVGGGGVLLSPESVTGRRKPSSARHAAAVSVPSVGVAKPDGSDDNAAFVIALARVLKHKEATAGRAGNRLTSPPPSAVTPQSGLRTLEALRRTKSARMPSPLLLVQGQEVAMPRAGSFRQDNSVNTPNNNGSRPSSANTAGTAANTYTLTPSAAAAAAAAASSSSSSRLASALGAGFGDVLLSSPPPASARYAAASSAASNRHMAIRGGGRSTGTIDVATVTLGTGNLQRPSLDGERGSDSDSDDVTAVGETDGGEREMNTFYRPQFVVETTSPTIASARHLAAATLRDMADLSLTATAQSYPQQQTEQQQQQQQKKQGPFGEYVTPTVTIPSPARRTARVMPRSPGYVYPDTPAATPPRPASAKHRPNGATHAYVDVLDLVEVMVLMWLESRYLASQAVDGVFSALTQDGAEELDAVAFEKLVLSYVVNAPPVAGSPLQAFVPGAGAANVKPGITLQGLVVDADKVDDDVRRVAAEVLKACRSFLTSRNNVINQGGGRGSDDDYDSITVQALQTLCTDGTLQTALRSSVNASSRLRRRQASALQQQQQQQQASLQAQPASVTPVAPLPKDEGSVMEAKTSK